MVLAEVSFVAVAAAEQLNELLELCRERCAAPEATLSVWVRVFESVLAASRIRKVQLQSAPPESEAAARGVVLRVEEAEPLNIVAKQRWARVDSGGATNLACVRARRVRRVDVGANAPQMLGQLGYAQSYEMLRRGHSFHHEHTTLSIFELCRRSTAGAEPWEAVSEDRNWVVEVLVEGSDDVQLLVAEADEWADALQPLAALQPHESSNKGAVRTSMGGQQVYGR